MFGDGLKPVQRRILYTMWHEGPTVEHAKVVGDVMGSLPLHWARIYETLVRMAQPVPLRVAPG